MCCLGGNGQFVRTEILREVGGWREDTLADDFDLTLTLMCHGYQVKYADITIWQVAVASFHPMIRQRTRWSQGNIQSTIKHFWSTIRNKRIPLVTKLDTLYVFSTMLQSSVRYYV
ncbi:glycosyltransferase [Sulfoacidibacillus thermotolerans]|uniref:glycosyltransferase n=1 Tax=Sulfoacidibacillus thermotolerans TaxID=1765684 RepID=UPI000D69750D